MSSSTEPDHHHQHHPFRWNYSEDFDDNNFQIHGHTLYSIFVLFSVLFLVTFIFLYGRWICSFFPTAQRGSPPGCRGLDRASILQLPVMAYNKVSGGELYREAECCICLGMFGDKDEVKVLPQCRHCFHSTCVDQWLKVHSTCPICRALVQVFFRDRCRILHN